MSRAEEKADLQVTRPGHIYPFGQRTSSPLTHITQWCRFTVPERLPLLPFRQDRLSKLPLPPSVMATSSRASSVSCTENACSNTVQIEYKSDVDPLKKIQQLEKNITFIQENHAAMLHSLHEEINDLKQKNRELQFQLITGHPAQPPETENSNKTDKDIPEEVKEKIYKLEKEVKKFRNALKDALKTNTALTHQIQVLKKKNEMSNISNDNKQRSTSEQSSGYRTRTPDGPSPEVEEYSSTLKQIQRAAGHRSGRNYTGRHYNHSNNEWVKGVNNYVENHRGYYHHYHHNSHLQQRQQHHHHQQQQQQQPRLPRLPLRNHQQNYLPPQYDAHYNQRSASTLPILKQAHNVAEHRADKQKKSRGIHAAKVVDKVSDH